MKDLAPFHLAVPVQNLEKCRTFYAEVLGCEEGRSDTHWVDLNLSGHQLVIHQIDGKVVTRQTNSVDQVQVPIPHFGVALPWEVWQRLVERLKEHHIQFIVAPRIRFQGEAGQQATMFFLYPDGNALEFKAFKNAEQLFRSE